jgi:hypothetical protein
VILAVAAFRVMQVSIDQVIDVVPVRDGLVAAAGSVFVSLFVAAAIVVGSCRCGISSVDGNYVLVHVSLVRMVHMSVVEIVRVALMLDCRMPASGTMLM